MVHTRDLHSSLKTETLATAGSQGIDLALQRLQWSKDDIGYSLHVRSNSFTCSGLQTTDLLGYLGFTRTACPVQHGDGYCRSVPEGFDVTGFALALASSHAALVTAERHLQACGIPLPQPEGWGHFFGKSSRGGSRQGDQAQGDGHTSPKAISMKLSEDDNFRYAFTWIEGGQDKGWTTHYRPKSVPLSPEVAGAFSLLALKAFRECPAFDFDPCYWKFVTYRDDFWGNAETAHSHFDAHAQNFSLGIEHLLAAHAAVEPFGLSLLPMVPASERRREQIAQRTVQPREPSRPSMPDYFDVAISFAGTDRAEAEQLAKHITEAGFSVFYDDMYGADLWGKNLADTFDDIYRKRARYCVIFVSKQYIEREWTNHERQSAQARAIKEKGKEYILPIKVDDVELPGMAPTICHVSLREHGLEKIAEMLVKKLAT